jgi:hypothetical protein
LTFFSLVADDHGARSVFADVGLLGSLVLSRLRLLARIHLPFVGHERLLQEETTPNPVGTLAEFYLRRRESV